MDFIELDAELARTEWQRRDTLECPALTREECEAEALRRVQGRRVLVNVSSLVSR